MGPGNGLTERTHRTHGPGAVGWPGRWGAAQALRPLPVVYGVRYRLSLGRPLRRDNRGRSGRNRAYGETASVRSLDPLGYFRSLPVPSPAQGGSCGAGSRASHGSSVISSATGSIRSPPGAFPRHGVCSTASFTHRGAALQDPGRRAAPRSGRFAYRLRAKRFLLERQLGHGQSAGGRGLRRSGPQATGLLRGAVVACRPPGRGEPPGEADGRRVQGRGYRTHRGQRGWVRVGHERVRPAPGRSGRLRRRRGLVRQPHPRLIRAAGLRRVPCRSAPGQNESGLPRCLPFGACPGDPRSAPSSSSGDPRVAAMRDPGRVLLWLGRDLQPRAARCGR